MTTLAEQVARVRAGDKVTATFKDLGDEFTITGTARGGDLGWLTIGDWPIRNTDGSPGDQLISLDGHKVVLKVGWWVKVTGFVSDLHALVGEVVGLGPETVLLDFGPRGRVDVNPAYLTRTEKPAPPEPVFQVGEWVKVTGFLSGLTHLVGEVREVLGDTVAVDFNGGLSQVSPAHLTRTEKPAPEPVKPAEPTEFGSIIKARAWGKEPRLWVQTNALYPWKAEGGYVTRYENLTDVEVIRDGTGGIPAEARDALVSEFIKHGWHSNDLDPVEWLDAVKGFAERLTGGATS